MGQDSKQGGSKPSLFAVSNANSKQHMLQAERLKDAFDSNIPGLRRFVRSWLGSDNQLDDVIQDVFCKALEYKDLARIDNLKAFLYKTTRNVLVDQYRRDQVKAKVYEQITADMDYQLDSKTEMDFNEMAIAFRETLKVLPQKTRQVYLLKNHEGFTSSEIAKTLGISERMVQKHLVKAILLFKDRLG